MPNRCGGKFNKKRNRNVTIKKKFFSSNSNSSMSSTENCFANKNSTQSSINRKCNYISLCSSINESTHQLPDKKSFGEQINGRKVAANRRKKRNRKKISLYSVRRKLGAVGLRSLFPLSLLHLSISILSSSK